MSTDDEIDSLLDQHGAVLKRTGTHNVYELPDGRIFVLAKTPSDHRASKNSIAALRKLLGVVRLTHKNPNRRKKTPPPKPPAVLEPTSTGLSLEDQLWAVLFSARHEPDE